MRKLTLAFSILNLVAAIAIPVVASLGVGIRETVVYSKFRELDFHGIIDHEGLRTYDGGKFAQSANDIPTWLTQGEDDWITFSWVVALICGINCIVFAVVWRSSRPGDDVRSDRTSG